MFPTTVFERLWGISIWPTCHFQFSQDYVSLVIGVKEDSTSNGSEFSKE